MKEGAVLCISCGFNTQTKKQLSSSSDGAAIARRQEIYAQQAAKANAKPIMAGGKSSTSSTSKSDDGVELGPLDYLFCFFCTGIALIVAIIYIVQGNPRGKKLLVAALICVAIGTVLNIIAFSVGIVGGLSQQ